MRIGRSALVGSFVALGLSLFAGDASAYPAAIIFAPTAESRPLGGVGGYSYGGSVVSPTPSSFRIAPWFGLQLGLVPQLSLGKGLTFGGAEVGVDAFGPGDGTLKPVVNLKISPIKQVGWVPGVGIGLMQVAPSMWDKSLNLGYVVLTEEVKVGRGEGFSIGTFTLGYAQSFAQFQGAGQEPMFHGTAPFKSGARGGLVLGYQSPRLGPLQLVADHIGGYSEASVTNLGAVVYPFDWAYVAAGYGLANDRADPYRADSVFAMLGVEAKVPIFEPSNGGAPAAKKDPGAQETRVAARRAFPLLQ